MTNERFGFRTVSLTLFILMASITCLNSVKAESSEDCEAGTYYVDTVEQWTQQEETGESCDTSCQYWNEGATCDEDKFQDVNSKDKLRQLLWGYPDPTTNIATRPDYAFHFKGADRRYPYFCSAVHTSCSTYCNLCYGSSSEGHPAFDVNYNSFYYKSYYEAKCSHSSGGKKRICPCTKPGSCSGICSGDFTSNPGAQNASGCVCKEGHYLDSSASSNDYDDYQYEKVGDFECDETSLQMYDGQGTRDNQGNFSQRLERCSRSCFKRTKTPTDGQPWTNFPDKAKGFTFQVSSGWYAGKCWCQFEDSATCTRIAGGPTVVDGKMRYDFKLKNPCIQCPANSFKNNIGNDTACTPCPENSQSEPGSLICTCNEGFEMAEDNSACNSPCPEGTTYEATPGMPFDPDTNCKCSCGDVKVENGQGCAPVCPDHSQFVGDCNDTAPDNITSCECDLGYYRKDGDATCHRFCPPHSEYIHNDSVVDGTSEIRTHCECHSGFDLSREIQKWWEDPSTTYNERQQYQMDEAYAQSIRDILTQQGDHRTYRQLNNRDDCLAWVCPPGSGLNETASDEGLADFCTPCLPGFFSPDDGLSCKSCELGSFSQHSNSSSCSACDPGTYSNTYNSTQCLQCEAGYYAENKSTVQCTKCPNVNTTSPAGSTSVHDCGCANGGYISDEHVHWFPAPKDFKSNHDCNEVCKHWLPDGGICDYARFNDFDSQTELRKLVAGHPDPTSMQPQFPEDVFNYYLWNSLGSVEEDVLCMGWANSQEQHVCNYMYSQSNYVGPWFDGGQGGKFYWLQNSDTGEQLKPRCDEKLSTSGYDYTRSRICPCRQEASCYGKCPNNSISPNLGMDISDCVCKSGYEHREVQSSDSHDKMVLGGNRYTYEKVGDFDCSDDENYDMYTETSDWFTPPPPTASKTDDEYIWGVLNHSQRLEKCAGACLRDTPDDFHAQGFIFNVFSKTTNEQGVCKCESGNSQNCTRNLGGYKVTDGFTRYDLKIKKECQPCRENTYKAGIGDELCHSCPLNAYAPIGSLECYCNHGYYWNNDNTSCIACAPGKYHSIFNAISEESCQTCVSGTYSSAGSPNCTQCPDNSLSDAGSKNISDCKCNAGWAGPDGGPCVSCQPGFFKSVSGSSECVQCDPGQSSQRDFASTYCVDCIAGKHSNPDLSECYNCGPGKYAPNEKMENCLECEEGQRSDEQWASKKPCHDCLAGTFLKKAVHTTDSFHGGYECESCSAGKYTSEDRSTTCTLCAEGMYNPDTGSNSSDACQTCVSGKYSAAGSPNCTQCPDNSLSDAGSKNISDCKCNAGWTGQDGGPCESCQPGSFKSEIGSPACTLCAKGKYNPDLGSNSSAACLPCAAGTFNGHEGQTACVECFEGAFSEPGSTEFTDCHCAAGSQDDSWAFQHTNGLYYMKLDPEKNFVDNGAARTEWSALRLKDPPSLDATSATVLLNDYTFAQKGTQSLAGVERDDTFFQHTNGHWYMKVNPDENWSERSVEAELNQRTYFHAVRLLKKPSREDDEVMIVTDDFTFATGARNQNWMSSYSAWAKPNGVDHNWWWDAWFKIDLTDTPLTMVGSSQPTCCFGHDAKSGGHVYETMTEFTAMMNAAGGHGYTCIDGASSGSANEYRECAYPLYTYHNVD